MHPLIVAIICFMIAAILQILGHDLPSKDLAGLAVIVAFIGWIFEWIGWIINEDNEDNDKH